MDRELVARDIVNYLGNNMFYKLIEMRNWLHTIMYSFFVDMVGNKNFNNKKLKKEKIDVLNYFKNFGFYVDDILKNKK